MTTTTLKIRPYQAEGLDFLVSHKRAALFDEPGLGKSMQALLAMDDLTDSGRILIVATGDALGVWQDECRRWLDIEPAVYAGLHPDEDEARDAAVLITNYHRLSTALDPGWSGGWDGVIFDEAQTLRNRKTRTLFASLRHLLDDRKYGLRQIPMFFLSGTPIVKAAGDLWPILHAIDKVRWSSYWKFVQKYAITWQDAYGWHTEGVTNARGLWAELDSVALRRTKAQVQGYLPPKIRKRVPLTMTPKQAKAYRQMEKEMYFELEISTVHSGPVSVDDIAPRLFLTSSVLGKETRLRQILVCPRLVGIDDDGAGLNALADIAASHQRPFVVFTPFAEALPWLTAKLERAGRPTYAIRGGSMGDLDLFKRAIEVGEAPVLCSTVQMGKSWSVAAYTYECYMLGYDWNATTMLQAEDRLHRDGQKDTVLAQYFVNEGTHDVDALDVVGAKKRLADVIVDRLVHHKRVISPL